MSKHTVQSEEWKAYLALWNLDKLFLPGQRINWRTGESSVISKGPKTSHCSEFLAAIAHHLQIPLSPTPDEKRSWLANAMYKWLSTEGSKAGWHEIEDDTEAQDLANHGWFVLAIVNNPIPKQSGHVAIVLPEEKKKERKRLKIHVMHAGLQNCMSEPLLQAFKHHRQDMDRLKFFAYPISDYSAQKLRSSIAKGVARYLYLLS